MLQPGLQWTDTKMVDSPTAVKGQGESRRDTGRETALLIAVFPTDAKEVENADVRRFSFQKTGKSLVERSQMGQRRISFSEESSAE